MRTLGDIFEKMWFYIKWIEIFQKREYKHQSINRRE